MLWVWCGVESLSECDQTSFLRTQLNLYLQYVLKQTICDYKSCFILCFILIFILTINYRARLWEMWSLIVMNSRYCLSLLYLFTDLKHLLLGFVFHSTTLMFWFGLSSCVWSFSWKKGLQTVLKTWVQHFELFLNEQRLTFERESSWNIF